MKMSEAVFMIRKIPWVFRNLDKLGYQVLQDNDYLLATLQHSGTHWLKFMIAKAIVDYYELDYEFEGIQSEGIIQHLSYDRKFLYNDLNQVPRVQHTHQPYKSYWMPLLWNKKIILLIRDLRDALVSHYEKHEHHLPHQSFSSFLREEDLECSKRYKETYRLGSSS